MAESTKPGRRRARRSTRVSRQLAEARKRNAEQLAKQRKQEETVEEALASFFDASDQIAAADDECQRRIEPHERAIAQLREQRDLLVADQEQARGLAALAIHEADRTVEQVGELLGLGEKPARRLITTGREATAKRETGAERGSGEPPAETTPEVRQEEPRADDDRHVGPAVAPNGGEAATSGGDGWPAVAGGGRGEPTATPEVGAVSA